MRRVHDGMVSTPGEGAPPMEALRNAIVGGLHLGHLKPGDRLPSVRAMAEEVGADHRVVSAAYRTLESEGILEVRGRRGAFIAQPERLCEELTEEKARWLTGVLVEARRRRTVIPRLPDLIRDWTARHALRCACVESSTDFLAALCQELADDFGVRSSPVHAAELEGEPPAHAAGVPAPVREADLLVTTGFHAPLIRRLARELGKPAIVVTMAGEVVSTIERHLAERPLTLICVDEAFARRFRALFRARDTKPDRLRIVLADDAAALDSTRPDTPVLITHAAAELVPAERFDVVLPLYPSISHESAGEVAGALIRHNLAHGA